MDAVSLDPLLDELEQLRETVGALRRQLSKLRISLAPVERQRFLGQPLTIVAVVSDPVSGRPVTDAPVTFAASWGRLSGSDGLGAREGAAVTLRSGIDGVLRVVLNAPTSEPLRGSQQSALEAMLALLDGGATAPRGIRASFEILAREYKWEANFEFRQAVDIYFRDFRRSLTGTVNLRDYLESWSFFDTAVTAYAREDEAGELDTQVQAAAVLDYRFKDWISPWFETYLALEEAGSGLGADFERLKKEHTRAGPLLEGIYGRAQAYVGGQRGRVGEFAGNRVVGKSLDTFLKSGFADLELEERLALAPALQVAAASITKTGISVVSAVGQSQKDLRKEIAAKTDPRVGELGTKVGSLETALAAKADLAELNAFRASTSAALGTKLNSITFNTQIAAKADLAELDALRTATNNALGAKLNSATFTAFQNRMDTALAAKVEMAAFNEAIGRKVDKTEFTTFQTRVDLALGARVTVTDFNAALAGKTDVSTFNTFRDQTNRSLETKVDRTRFEAFANTTTTELGTLRETNRTLSTSIGTIERRIRVLPLSPNP